MNNNKSLSLQSLPTSSALTGIKNTVNLVCFRCILLAGIAFVMLSQNVMAAGAKYPEARQGSSYQGEIADGAQLPKNRIVGYYGNFYSKRMGVLGEYPPEVVIRMLKDEMRKWSAADPNTPVTPAIEYIAVVAQKDPGKDGKYRARMSDAEIQKAIDLAEKVDGIVILDVQVGLSSVQSEIPRLEKFLKMPNVMLALDPEFSMPPGKAPGKVIGSMDARDINFAIEYLSGIVRKYDLPPKVLVIHRFTKKMVTNHKNIKIVPQVQVVMNMDGWGPRSLKTDSYRAYIAAEPVQFTGVKMFYKNDLKNNSTGLFTPEQLLRLNPVPMFILYQ